MAVTDVSAQPVSRANVQLTVTPAAGPPVIQDGNTNRSGVVTFAFLPESADGEGSYSVTADATKSDLFGSAASAFDVAGVVASCELCGFGEQVSLTLTLFANGAPLADALVLLEVTTPSGVVLSGGGVTDADGQLTLSFTPVRNFGAGTYAIEAGGGSSWYTFSYGSTITVQ